MSLFYWIYLILFLILICVYVGAFIFEKWEEKKAKKEFNKRQERYKKML